MSMICNFKQISPERLEKIKKDPSLVELLIYSEKEEDRALSIGKAWHGIHFLLTGKAEGGEFPSCTVIMGGIEIGPDLGYGPARYLGPEEVKRIAEGLLEVSKEGLKKGFDPRAMTEANIYPETWLKESEIELEYLLEEYERLFSYYQDASRKGNAMLIYLI